MTSVLIVGSGAREHALVWKLRQSPEVDRILVAPGNAGTGRDAENVTIAVSDVPGLVRVVRERDIGLTVVGPEEPLALGLADALRAENRLVVGPGAGAARIESSKAFAKQLMLQCGVPTAQFRAFTDPDTAFHSLPRATYPLVIKADGLAAGKGVSICHDEGEARRVVQALMVDRLHGFAGQRIVVEEMLTGPEISLLAFVDGERAVPLPLAQDHKRLHDGDAGPNTGGMGAYAPVLFVSEEERETLVARIIQPIVDGLDRAGMPYRGILFAGLMLTPDGPRVLEFNCRFGDPETQVILPLLAGDLFPWLMAVATGRLEGTPPIVPGSAAGVVLASAGYPDRPATGKQVHGLDALPSGTLAFHAGTALDADGRVVTAGGRVLTIVGTGATTAEAAARAYSAPMHFEGMQRRMDIGWQAGGDCCRSAAAPPPLPSRQQCGFVGPERSPSADVSGVRLGWANGTGVQLPPERRQSSRATTMAAAFDTIPVSSSVVVLASGAGSNLQALLDARANGKLDGEIAAVISHNPDAGALDRARAAGIPALTLPLVSPSTSRSRVQFEQDLLVLLRPYRPDVIVLAGWMRILSAHFIAACACPLINVHPALLDAPDIPIIRGQHAVRDALAFGLPYTGVTVHHVTAEVDAGPVILSEQVEIVPGDTEETLYARIKPVEHRLLVEAVQTVLHSYHLGGVYA